MRGLALTALALVLATQGAEIFAAPGQRTWSHSGGRPAAAAVAHHHHHPATVIRVVPRYVYVAPYVPYYPTPYYPTSSYYPSSSYSTPSYYPPEPPAYAEQPQAYAPPPPPASSTQQPAPAQPGPYSMEQGIQYRYLCLDTRRFYPDTKECPSGWLTVLPGGGNPPR